MADTSFFVKTKTRAEADAWVTVLRGLGLVVLGPPSDVLSSDGRWVIRAEAPAQQRQPDRTWTASPDAVR
jgi:hypothetical protein